MPTFWIHAPAYSLSRLSDSFEVNATAEKALHGEIVECVRFLIRRVERESY